MPVRARIVLLLFFLVLANVALWLLTWHAAQHFTFLFGRRAARFSLLTAGAAALAYGYGLRHAVDADHISAIDNTTRRLLQQGQRPIGVGFYFSLGHSTIVLLLSAGLALAAGYVQRHMHQWQTVGGIVGTLISTIFLYLIGLVNLIVLWDLARTYRRVHAGKTNAEEEEAQGPRGPMARLLRPLLRMVTQSWQMYFIGLLFGLGFDTATEVGVLALTAKSGQAGIPFWVILLLPLLFTAGMCLVDTLDGILMLGAYGWAFLEPKRKLGYNIIITLVSVLVAFVVGTEEFFGILAGQNRLHVRWIDAISSLDLDKIGVGFWIVGLFGLIWLLALLWYRRPAKELAP